jgi:hypothetical protein
MMLMSRITTIVAISLIAMLGSARLSATDVASVDSPGKVLRVTV